MNDERFKSGSSMNYFHELLDRIREIRISERLFYQQIKDIYATSIDYDPSDQMTLAFYKEALDLTEVRRKDAEDGSFTLVYLGDGTTPHLLELTWLRDMDRPYNLGDNEIHLAFEVDDFDAAHKKHKEMGCICYENPGMGIYFISDPDGYWLEIVPQKLI